MQSVAGGIQVYIFMQFIASVGLYLEGNFVKNRQSSGSDSVASFSHKLEISVEFKGIKCE